MIHCQQLSRRYGNRFAVQSVDLHVAEAELVVLVGPSGCGKSTLLKMINRLIEPSSGDISVDGQKITAIALTELRRQMGYVIQSTGLFPHWNVANNIATVPKLLGWSNEQINRRTEELMQTLGLTPITQFKHKYPHELSGGQAQRVGVARALAADPKVLLMDEPFAALDPITRAALQVEVRRLQQQTQKTVIFVTHDMDEALVMADKIAIMQNGKLIQFGKPIDLLINPVNDFVRTFIGQSDLGLKLLSQRQVAQYVHAASITACETRHYWQLDSQQRPQRLIGGKLDPEQRQYVTTVNAEWLAVPTMSMKEALSRMVWYRVSVLPVVNEHGVLIGEVSLRAMMQPPAHAQSAVGTT
ncbi:MAG: ABC transporter [Gammaproteobacteria bacterium]|nr:MAG: ABC transporter [Gammaproteobacteria bacterium]